MGNKSELQIHNLDLQSILQTVNSQPTAVPWGGSTDIIAGTQDIVIPAYTDTELTVKGDADLIASNIKKGIELFGVTGTLEESVTKADTGIITLTDSVSGFNIEINHSLGEPVKSFLMVVDGVNHRATYSCFMYPYNYSDSLKYVLAINNLSGEYASVTVNTNNSFCFVTSSMGVAYGTTYRWYAIA